MAVGITVDGCEYLVDVTASLHHNGKEFSIYDLYGNLYAEVDINHDWESITVEWSDGDDSTNGSYPYFEYEGNDMELIRWVVSTAPWV